METTEAKKNLNILEMFSTELVNVKCLTSKQAGDILVRLSYVLENNSKFFYENPIEGGN